MPVVAKELSDLEVKRLQHSGKAKGCELKAVGGVPGLHLQIAPPNKKGVSIRSWILRTKMQDGRRRDLGLGPYPRVALTEARDRAEVIRHRVKYEGFDPAEERRKAREDAKQARKAEAQETKLLAFTVKRAYDDWLEINRSGFNTKKGLTDFEGRMNNKVLPNLGGTPVSDVTVQHVVGVLKPMWLTQVDQANRTRREMENVFRLAVKNGYRTGNPATLDELQDFLPKRPSGKKKQIAHYNALHYPEAPEWFAMMSDLGTDNAKVAMVQALTALRPTETRGAKWEEFDFKERVWLVPGERMKSGDMLKVPLSHAVIEILQSLPRKGEYVFESPQGGKPVSDTTVRKSMKAVHEKRPFLDIQSKQPADLHALRSTFKDWASERHPEIPDEVSELALDHEIQAPGARKNYARSDLFDLRRKLMDSYAEFLQSAGATVIDLHAER